MTSPEVALVIGLLVGVIYTLCKRVHLTSQAHAPGGAFLMKWPNGIGRSSVMEVKHGVLRMSPPLMRQEYGPPAPGAEVILKPLAGGNPRRARFVGHGDAGWTVRLS